MGKRVSHCGVQRLRRLHSSGAISRWWRLKELSDGSPNGVGGQRGDVQNLALRKTGLTDQSLEEGSVLCGWEKGPHKLELLSREGHRS